MSVAELGLSGDVHRVRIFPPRRSRIHDLARAIPFGGITSVSRANQAARTAELEGDAGQREVANSPSAYDCYDQVGNLKEQH